MSKKVWSVASIGGKLFWVQGYNRHTSKIVNLYGVELPRIVARMLVWMLNLSGVRP